MQLHNVLDIRYNKELSELKICMVYLGDISKNSCKFRHPSGFTMIKKEIKEWMRELSAALRLVTYSEGIVWQAPIKVEIECYQSGRGRPLDCGNLCDIISDSVRDGVSVDDRFFEVLTVPSKRAAEAKIVITVTNGGCRDPKASAVG